MDYNETKMNNKGSMPLMCPFKKPLYISVMQKASQPTEGKGLWEAPEKGPSLKFYGGDKHFQT